MAQVKNNLPLSPRPQKQGHVDDARAKRTKAKEREQEALADGVEQAEQPANAPVSKDSKKASPGDSVGPSRKGNRLFADHSHVDNAPAAGEDPTQAASGFKADPLGLGALQGRTPARNIQKFAEKLVALAEGIDSGVVFGKRLETILKQLPALSYGDIDRLFAPATKDALAEDRTAYRGALERLSEVAPTLEVPPMGLQALEAARLFSLQESLLLGDDAGAVACGKEAAALFPDSPLVEFYLAPLKTRPTSTVDDGGRNDTAPLADEVASLAQQRSAGTLGDEELANAVRNLPFPEEGLAPESFCKSFAPLVEQAPNAPIFGDQTLAEAHAYAHVLGLAAAGKTSEAKVEADAFAEAYPESDRAPWLKDIVLSD